MIFVRKEIFIFMSVVLLLAASFVVPMYSVDAADAAEGIVNCGGTGQQACTICHLVEGVHRIVQFIVKLIIVTALTVMTIAGIMYIISAGRPGMTELAKKAMMNTLIGITIILVAHMSITVILNNIFKAKTDVLSAGGLTGMAGNTWSFTCDTTSLAGTNPQPPPSPESPQPPQPPQLPQPKPPNPTLTCSESDCPALNDAIKNNAYGVDPNILKSIMVAGEGCNPSVSKDGFGSCGYGQVLPKYRKWCGISGSATDSCSKVQQDVRLDVNCAAKLIKEGNSRCGTSDINVVASCYNAGQPGRCDKTTKNYCGRVSDYYAKCQK